MSQEHSRQPIDTIWVAPGLVPLASGYLPFSQGFPSDHRLIWFDVVKDMFLSQSPILAVPKPRCLKASDPQLVDKYVNMLIPGLLSHQLLSHIRTIQHEASQTGWKSDS